MTSQMNKLNSPLIKFSLQSPTKTEYSPWIISYEETPLCRTSTLTEHLPISILDSTKQVQVVVITHLQSKHTYQAVVEQEIQFLAHSTVLEYL